MKSLDLCSDDAVFIRYICVDIVWFGFVLNLIETGSIKSWSFTQFCVYVLHILFFYLLVSTGLCVCWLLSYSLQPIPYWLYKLHGLNINYNCEICGNYTYRGPKAFQRHFAVCCRFYQGLTVTEATLLHSVNILRSSNRLSTVILSKSTKYINKKYIAFDIECVLLPTEVYFVMITFLGMEACSRYALSWNPQHRPLC